jgi:hypothetical protein|tara:strand:- start:828 stop:1250 length:423 start_codon:yes stop_codon:yes gene_type:complete
MAFKLGSEKREFKTRESIGPIIRKDLDKGVLGEANNDGSIYISKDIRPNSKQEKQVIKHEAKHADDMKKGILDYGDDWVRYKGRTYPRKDGEIKYNNKWLKEGSNVFPWEKRAVKAEKTKTKITSESPQRYNPSAAFQKK